VEAPRLVRVGSRCAKGMARFLRAGRNGRRYFARLAVRFGFLTEGRQSTTHTFMSPVVVHFTTVFFLSARSIPVASGQILRRADWRHRFDRCNPFDLHHGPGRAYRHDELCGGLLGLRLVARPRLPRAARGRRVDLSRKGLWAG
jgi:hypothetical protein